MSLLLFPKPTSNFTLITHLHSLNMTGHQWDVRAIRHTERVQDQAWGKGGWQAVICTADCCSHLQAGAAHVHIPTGTLSHTQKHCITCQH